MHQQWVPVPILEGQGFYQGNDQIWVPKQKKATATNRSHQDKMQPKTSKTMKMVWVRKDKSAISKPCPSPLINVQCKRAEPQEPTWRRVMPKVTLQKVEPQEPAPNDKGNIASSSTSMTPVLKASTTIWEVRPKVVTEEPTEGKTNHLNNKPQ